MSIGDTSTVEASMGGRLRDARRRRRAGPGREVSVVAEPTTCTIRFLDRGGARAAMAALTQALRAAGAPRETADDVRLAVELVLDHALSDGPDVGGAVLALAATQGQIAVETRMAASAAIEPSLLAALVDEVDVAHDGGSVVTLSRSWSRTQGRR